MGGSQSTAVVEVVVVEGGLEGKSESWLNLCEIHAAMGMRPQRTNCLGVESIPPGPRRPDWDFVFFLRVQPYPNFAKRF